MGLEMADAARPASPQSPLCDAVLSKAASQRCFGGGAVRGGILGKRGGEGERGQQGHPTGAGALQSSMRAVAEQPGFGCWRGVGFSGVSTGSPGVGHVAFGV